MKETTIISGPVEVISTGSVIAYWQQPIELNVVLEDFTLRLIFKFEETEDKTMKAVPTIVENDRLEILFTNYSSSLGAGNAQPLGIGSSLGRQLTLSYRIYTLTEGADKLLHYTIYRRMEE